MVEYRFNLEIKSNKDFICEVGNCWNGVYVNELWNIMNLYILNSYTDKSVAYDIKTGCTNCVPNRYNEFKLREYC